MSTTVEAAPARPSETVLPPARPTPRRNSNAVRYREEWLEAATKLFRPMFEKAGSPLPDLGRAAIGFTSRGRKGHCLGECWHGVASGDGHYEIFIRPDKAEPVEVLGILAHELVHAAVPVGSGHGPVYRALAGKIGLEGKMREALPGMHLTDILRKFAEELGPIPHASLNIEYRESSPRKKQKTNLLKCSCPGIDTPDGSHEACDYLCRITSVHAKKAAPLCGVHRIEMTVHWPDSEEGEGDDGEDGEPRDAAPEPGSGSPGSDFKARGAEAVKHLVEAGEWREAVAGEVHPPGQQYRVNVTTNKAEVRPLTAERDV